MRVMADARLANERDAATELLITLQDQAGVLLPRHHFIRVAENIEQRHLGSGKRCEVIDRIFGVSLRLVVGLEAVELQHQLPVAVTALAFAEAAGPALEI